MTASAATPSSTASIVNVAALANVSTATVSRVLSGKRTKDDDIARRVREAADRLGYSANYAASALRSAESNTIGLIIPGVDDVFSTQLTHELEPLVNAEGRQLALGIGGTREDQKKRIGLMAARRVDGLIVTVNAGSDPADLLAQYARTMPIVQIGGYQSTFRTSQVSIDDEASMDMGLDHLAGTGRRSVAFMAGDGNDLESRLLEMFPARAQRFGLFTRGDWNRTGELSVYRGFECAMRLYCNARSGDTDFRARPDALLCRNDAVALGAMTALRALHLRVPQDVAVIGYGDSPLAAIAMPQLTTVRPPTRKIAAEALRLIAAGPDSPAHITLPSRLIVRGSSARTAVS